MPNLRELAVSDVKSLNTKDWGLQVELTDPAGIRYTTDAETGETLKAIQVLYDYRKFNPETGEEIIVHEPIVIMALGSLSRVPVAGEKWQIKFPIDPANPAVLSDDYVLSELRAPEGGQSLGYIRLYPHKVKQSA
jgi:hypothetical protein